MRWPNGGRSLKFRRGLLLALIAVVLVRLSLLTYWSWDNLDSMRAARMLMLMWGLGLIAVSLLLRFLRRTYRVQPIHQSRPK